jgi:hypothetical protein
MVEFAKESDAMYLEQIVDWREGSEPDDAPDSLSSLAREGGYSSVSTFGGWGMWKM